MGKGYVSMKEMREYLTENILPMKDRQQEIKRIIAECESVQDSNESGYTKECARLRAYDDIKAVMNG